MSIHNRFNFIGEVYGDSTKFKTKDGKTTIGKFTLVVYDHFGYKKNYIPLTCVNKMASKMDVICKNGNIVAVEGEITSQEEIVNQKLYMRMFFMLTDIVLISKIKQKKINLYDVQNVLDLYSPDTLSPPKIRGRK